MDLICILAQLYVLALFARILLSWFPIDPHGQMGQIVGFLFMITEPVLAPVRSVLPRMGMFDFSPLIVLIGIQLLLRSLGCSMIL